jgi:hypothetical protein
MAKIDIPGLVIKRRDKKLYHYWQPSATLKRAGWQSVPLGTDPRAAQRAAEQQNDKVAEWRAGGAAPRTVKKFIKGGTVDQLIARYITDRFPELGEKTRKEYRTKLNIIQRWAGAEQVSHIDRKRVRKLKEVLLRPDKDGVVKLHRAAGAMRVLKTLLEFAIDAGFLPEDTRNPASNQNMPTPPARAHIWSQAAIDAVTAAAIEEGQPGAALGIRLGREIGQREADILKLVISRWIEIPRHKLNPEDWDALAEPSINGPSVWGVRLRQGKTNRWVEIPLVGQTRRLMETAIAEAKAMGTTVILHEMAIPQEFRDVTQFERHLARSYARETGRIATPEQIEQMVREGYVPRPWTETRFQRAIARIRDKAAEQARAAGDEELAAEIETVEFRDLRRTAVVSLGELGIEDQLIAAITGHQLDHTKKILETYMPRTTKMAGRAIALQQERSNVTPIDRSKQADGR